MALLDEILTWSSKDLKPWQSDAVRRLFQTLELRDPDFSELLLMLKASKGIAVEDSPAPIPLAAVHLPTSAAASEAVVLEALHSLKHVNRIAEGQRLNFVPKGLTVVFGENGAGKSGYSRVIKSACRARVKDEPVLPDARQHELLHDTPEAVFVINKNGRSVDVDWRADAAAPVDLASVAVLDTRCARAYTDQEGELIFAPWGLDVVENLARVVFPRLEQAIRQDQEKLPVSDAAFADLKAGETSVAKFLKALSHTTTDDQVRQVAAFSPEDAERLMTVEAALAEKSPAERARELRELSVRMNSLAETLEALREQVSDARLRELEELDRRRQDTAEAEALAATQLRAGDQLLEGTGKGPWRALFTAAQAFVSAHDHRGSEGSPCPLCQTPLSAEAASRMQRFTEYVANDVSVQAAAQRKLHEEAFRTIAARSLQAALDQTTVDYVEAHVPGWTKTKEQFVRDLQSRRDWAVRAGTESHDWSVPPAVSVDPVESVRRVVASVVDQADTLTKATDAAARPALQQEAAELRAKDSLSQRLEALLALTAAKRNHRALAGCLADLKTKPISDKAGALAGAAVTKQLSDALNEEFAKLGVSHLHTSLKARNDKGRTKVKLVLDLPGAQRPELVLSEGEQRVIAIGSFFAELRVSHHQGAAVFDDPVSSLDHQRRQHVARRLIEEAKNRQVVVFTHDTVFLAELMTEVESTGVAHAYRHLTYSRNAAGQVNDGLPWRHLKTDDRIDKLEKLVRALAKDEPGLDNVAAESRSRDVYGKLREVIERAVEEVVFCGVLLRYNDYVRVPNINKTVGLTSNECRPIVALYDRVSDVINGHDKAGARGFAPPTAADAAADVATLRQALNAIRDRRKPAKAA